MFDEPNEPPKEDPADPAVRAREKADEFRVHAQLAAVFEGPRKFDAALVPGLDPKLAREIQQIVGRLEKARTPNIPVLPEPSAPDAARLLDLPAERGLSTGDYHIHRRPGEVIILRWLAGDEVETFYGRLQAHFDAALDGYKEDERQASEWKQDPKKAAYLTALDGIQVKMADRFLREAIRTHRIFVLSTQTADEINIAYLADHLMGVPPADLVGVASAPPTDEEPTEKDLAWFFKLFLLRGMSGGGKGEVEQMCFFTFLQKTDDSFDF